MLTPCNKNNVHLTDDSELVELEPPMSSNLSSLLPPSLAVHRMETITNSS